MSKKTLIIASDSFKGTLSSLDICHLFEDVLKNNNDFSIISLPLADGGEGSLESISKILDGEFIDIEVDDLYFHRLDTHFYIDNHHNAYIETASCVGLSLAKENNDPGLVTTYGLGEQIARAIDMDVKNIYVFLGGSASNDGGVGLASALGTKFYNSNHQAFIPTGLTIKDIVSIDNVATRQLLQGVNIVALSDVRSPFYGVEGAAYKFAPQKGASEEEVKLLDDGLKHLANIIKRDLGIDISNIPGGGAAGGLGGGLVAFLNASISSGINTILDLINFDDILDKGDIVISGEGKLDKQTLDGKVIDGVATHCLKKNKPLYVIVGISEISLKDIKETYPCIEHIYETNYRHLPFKDIKASAKEDYIEQIHHLLMDL